MSGFEFCLIRLYYCCQLKKRKQKQSISIKVPTPFFYSLVSMSGVGADTTKNLRFSIFTRADAQQPAIGRKRAEMRQDTQSINVAFNSYTYLAFPGLLRGSSLDCMITKTNPSSALSAAPYSMFYFANITAFRDWASNTRSTTKPLIATSSISAPLSLTTTIDSQFSLINIYFLPCEVSPCEVSNSLAKYRIALR